MAALVGGATALLLLGACTSSRSGDDADSPGGEPPVSATPSPTAPPTTGAATTTIDPPATTADPPATSTSEPATSTTPATTAPPPSTTTTTTPPTTTAPDRPPRPPRNPCVWRVRPGDSLSLIADSVHNRRVTVRSLQRENSIADPNRINAGDKIDVCVGNRIDDITGKKRTPPPPQPPQPERPTSPPSNATGAAAQQQKVNELFAGLGMPALAVDGDSGPLTEQQLCATRMALNLPISRDDVEPGSPEERTLMSARSLSIPSSAPTWAGRWALVDQTCQVMLVGEGESLAFAFPISTGESEFPTRDQDASRVFRYDPALENNGWHDSSLYPAAEDNPLNGNMYKPLYFDNGQAIHGANTVPPYPASHGCVRVPVDLQDALVNWLGLGDVGGATYDTDLIGLTVTVQGDY
jgi:hypothetical protein